MKYLPGDIVDETFEVVKRKYDPGQRGIGKNQKWLMEIPVGKARLVEVEPGKSPQVKVQSLEVSARRMGIIVTSRKTNDGILVWRWTDASKSVSPEELEQNPGLAPHLLKMKARGHVAGTITTVKENFAGYLADE